MEFFFFYKNVTKVKSIAEKWGMTAFPLKEARSFLRVTGTLLLLHPVVFQLMTHSPVLPAGLCTSMPGTVPFISALLISRHRTQHNVAVGQIWVEQAKEWCQVMMTLAAPCLSFNQTLKDNSVPQAKICVFTLGLQIRNTVSWILDCFQRGEEGGAGRVVIAAT